VQRNFARHNLKFQVPKRNSLISNGRLQLSSGFRAWHESRLPSVARHTNILLVDDDLTVRQSLGNALTSENFHVFQAANSQEALNEFGKNQIDLLLLDLHLSGESGWDTLDQIRGLHPQLPVIVISGHPDKVTRQRLAAIQGFMEKPLDLPSLFGIIGQVVGHTQSNEPVRATIQ
jgi:DNA-binding NtrC family response regulator